MADINEAIITGYLKQLRLPDVAQHLVDVTREAEEDGRSYLDFLRVLLEAEITQRRENLARRLLSQAKFPVSKGLENFHFDALPSLDRQKVLNLARGEFVDTRRNAILIGNSGTGKTHLAMGIGQELCRRGYKVRFYTAAGLVNITKNLEFARRTEVFGDAHMTGALIDRLTHRAHILVMNGDSYRFRESIAPTASP